MRKPRTGTGSITAAAIMLLALLFALPVTAAPALSAGGPCHAMTAPASDTSAMAMMAQHPCCDHHKPGQPCPDDSDCGAACMSQCTAAAAFLPGACVQVLAPRSARPVLMQASWLASHQSRLDAPPPRI